MVNESPWPLYMSLSLFASMVSMLDLVTFSSLNLIKVFTIVSFFALTFNGWTRDISSEGAFLGAHTLIVQKGLKMGFVLFILSEVMFFVSFFWGLFYISVTPSINLGGWPPLGMNSINPLGIPLLGTLLLMSSGISVTWSHYSLMKGDKSATILSLAITISLGILFTSLQMMEYLESSFTISDSSYGSFFYMTTGFHGVHVLVGSMFLIVCMIRIMKDQLSKYHHVGFELAIWYWHFVDVVWLFLYVCLYWWGW